MEFNFSDRISTLKGNAIREIFKVLADPDIISFAGGIPTNSLLPTEEIRLITDELLSSKDGWKVLQYGATEGYPKLIKIACDYVKRYGIEGIEKDNVLIVSGGQQTIDLVFKSFVNKGDYVLVENPTYLASLHILKTYQGKAIGVDAKEDGLDLEDLEKKIITYKPKVLYCVPTFSNPTGKTYSVENRKAIAELTAKYGVILLEDDPYSEIRFEGERVPSIKGLCGGDHIIYTTSFSKVIAPGLRVGIAVGNKEIIRKMAIGKQAADVHSSILSQAIVAEYIARGFLFKHINQLIPSYREKKNAMINAIKKYMPDSFKYTNPQGGLFIWGEFDYESGINTKRCFVDCCKQKAAYVSGESFYASEDVFNGLRLNFSNASFEEIDRGIHILGDYFKEQINLRKK